MRNLCLLILSLLVILITTETETARADNDLTIAQAGQCCRVNNTHPTFSCSNLTAIGASRCNAAWSGGVPGAGPCQWLNVKSCRPIIIKKPVPECCRRANRSHPQYNCNQWTSYGNPVGKNRCNAAWSGGTGVGPCKWIAHRRCLRIQPSFQP